MTNDTNELWADVTLGDAQGKLVTFRTGMLVHEESLSDGRLIGRGWNGSGFVSFAGGRLESWWAALPQVFRLDIDGQSLGGDWQWTSFEKHADSQPIPAMPRPFPWHTVLTLTHAVRPVTVKVHTGLDGTAVLTRWLEITNTGDRPAALASVASWSGVLCNTSNWRARLPEGAALYSLGYFGNTAWGCEGEFHWVDLPEASYSVDGRYRRGRHRHPFFVVRNNATGEHFTGQFAWSGGYRFEFDVDGGQLTFAASTDAPAPQRVLAPGETVTSPELHLGLTFGGLDEAINSMHAHVRRSVIMRQPLERGSWVESGIGPEVEITAEAVSNAIEAAADFGAEVFFVDASWYAKPNSDWATTVGDWQIDLERFPGGAKVLREHVQSKGMLWGLWMEPERVGLQSRVALEHPDWLAKTSGAAGHLGGQLDLANPAAAAWVEQQIVRVIEENELDFFRLDYNTDSLAKAQFQSGEYVESSFWRYYEVLYGIFDRVRQRFPDLVLENCASGGARTDLGMVRRFSHTWVTDWQIAPRSFAITNGLTMALPPEYVDRVLGGQNGHTAADFDFQSRLLLFVRPSIGFAKPPDAQWNPHLLARVRHFVGLYKDFVRPFQSTSRIYHHTPDVSPLEPRGWGVLELVSADRTRGICGLFQLSVPTAPEYCLRLRGLNPGLRYRVTFDNAGYTCEIEAATLMQQGMTIRLEGALTSELLRFVAL